MSVAVIVVNWNSGDLLKKCLDSLDRQTLVPSRVIIVDNNSADDSLEHVVLQKNYLILKMEKNLGFAEANNQAIALCDEKYIALLNPDAFPEVGWLESLVAAAEENIDAAAFASRQMKAGFDNVLDGVGDVYHISGLAWRAGYGVDYQPVHQNPRSIFSACAGAALYRRDALVSAGGFDNDFFCYMEDVDLGFRLQLVGYSSMYVPDAVVEHVGSATTGGQRSDFSVYHGHRNMTWVFVKNMPGALFWLLLPLHILLSIFVIGVFVMRGQAGVILRAKKDAIKGLPHMWSKRYRIQASRKVTLRHIWAVLDKSIFR